MKHMLQTSLLVILLAMASGCASGFFTKPAPQASLPVAAGVATTNDFQTVAWLNYVSSLNAASGPNPAQPVVATLLGGLIAVAASVGTWMQHRNKGVDLKKA